MRFKKKVKLGYPRKSKKKFIKSQGRLFYKLRTIRLVRDIIIRRDMRILPSLLTNNTLKANDVINYFNSEFERIGANIKMEQ